MLQAAVRGATKTRLMYEAFLSHSQAEEYISFLLGKKLIALGPDNKHYQVTEKGLRFLAMFGEIKDAVTVEIQPAHPEPQTQSPENQGAGVVVNPRPEAAEGGQSPRLGVAQSHQRERPTAAGKTSHL